LCERVLPQPPRPILQIGGSARILIVAQAPGRRAHLARKPFADPSGDRLRAWLGIGDDVFYDERRVAIFGMGLCFPGTGRSGDLPPRPECAPMWHQRLIRALPNVRMTLLVGQYALAHYLGDTSSVTEAVGSWREHWPAVVPLPHPSWRNNAWLRRNPWFEAELVPQLRVEVSMILGPPTPSQGRRSNASPDGARSTISTDH
jgi:uracil-DNA glycosylase